MSTGMRSAMSLWNFNLHHYSHNKINLASPSGQTPISSKVRRIRWTSATMSQRDMANQRLNSQ